MRELDTSSRQMTSDLVEQHRRKAPEQQRALIKALQFLYFVDAQPFRRRPSSLKKTHVE